jgi:DNA polymerase III epsilon subunit-like protein
MNNYVFYGVDTETTGIKIGSNVIELSLYRLSDDIQRTWFIRPIDFDTIELEALRVNHHKLEDLRGETKYGRETYMDPKRAIVEVENWLNEDDVPTAQRCLVAHNAAFDKGMLEHLWLRCEAQDSFPFGRRYLDTMQIALMLDYVEGNFDVGYSLSNLSKKYSIKNEKAHSAAADTKCMVEIFRKQAAYLKKALKNNEDL